MHCPNSHELYTWPWHKYMCCWSWVSVAFLCLLQQHVSKYFFVNFYALNIFKIFRLKQLSHFKTWFVYFHFWFFIYKNAVCGWLLHLCILLVFCYAICPPRGKFSESWGSNINIQLQRGRGNKNSNGNMAYQLQKIETCSREKTSCILLYLNIIQYIQQCIFVF